MYWLKRILKVEQIACDLIGSYVANERRSIMGSNSMPFTSLLSNLAAVRMVLDEHLNGVGGYIGIVVGHWKATVQKCFLVDVLKQVAICACHCIDICSFKSCWLCSLPVGAFLGMGQQYCL